MYMQAAENLTDRLYIVVAKSGEGVAAYAAALLLLLDKVLGLVRVRGFCWFWRR